MSEFVERVAKAIYEVGGQDLMKWDALKVVAPQARQACIDAALRAIRAMRDPSGAMTHSSVCWIYDNKKLAEALNELGHSDEIPDGKVFFGPQDAELVWQKMIDCALRERLQ